MTGNTCTEGKPANSAASPGEESVFYIASHTPEALCALRPSDVASSKTWKSGQILNMLGIYNIYDE